MINLLRADLRRIRSRRAVVGVALGLFALLLLIDGIQYSKAKPRQTNVSQTAFLPNPPPNECVIERAPRLVVNEECFYRSFGDAGAVQIQPSFPDGPKPTGIEVDLARVEGSTTFAKGQRGSIGGWGIGLSLASLIIASTFIGGDYGTALVGQMLFEPRRVRVYISKALAAILTCAALTVVVIALDGIFRYVTANHIDAVGHLDGTWFAHRLLDLARVIGCTSAAALTGLGFTMLMRRTAASLGIYFGSAIALQFITASETFRPFAKFIPLNALIFVALLPHVSANDNAPFHSNAVAAGFLIGWVVIATIVGLGAFDRREVR